MHRLPIIVAVLVLLSGISVRAQQPQHQHQHQRPDHFDHRFDDPERYAKKFDDPARDAWQMPDRVIAALDLKAGQSIADVGAGTGYFSMRLAKLPSAPTVYADDIEPSMVQYLKARAAKAGLANVVPVLASAESPNLPAPVDVVLIVDTYHHIGDRVGYFRRLRTSLKPSGRVAIVDFRKDAPDGPPPQFRLDPAQIASELAQAGYVQAASYDFLPRQIYLVFRVK